MIAGSLGAAQNYCCCSTIENYEFYSIIPLSFCVVQVKSMPPLSSSSLSPSLHSQSSSFNFAKTKAFDINAEHLFLIEFHSKIHSIYGFREQSKSIKSIIKVSELVHLTFKRIECHQIQTTNATNYVKIQPLT